ncbi:SH3 domain-containing protein [Pseudomonas orientalis]|uniref:SH3 domain-containing protein n=1 Tax=Pseudomonas orientalis TaxID=76758 RepID=UPI000F572EF8|nr:SH3 domain-containing protein [Pseudomonas orientalis]AZE91625.1 hypothetical protein C4J97_4973 [Pseudomonas orientalis]
MSDEWSENLKQKGEIGYALAAAKAIQGLRIPKELYRIGETARLLTAQASIFSRSENLYSIGSVVKTLTSVMSPLNIVVDSPIGQAMSAIRKMDVAFNTSKSLTAAARAVDSIGVSQKTVAALLSSPMSSEFFELIRSGTISAAQIESGFEEAIAVVGRAEDLPSVNAPGTNTADSIEVVTALLSNRSLKDLSYGALVYFLYVMLMAVAQDPIASINKGFELQRNLSGLFTSVETPAEARAQARRLPLGADKSELVGFRLVTGVDVHLMDEPSRQAEVVLKIRIGSLVQVLDASNRAWLYVSVVMDGELYEGWILRSYTKRIE